MKLTHPNNDNNNVLFLVLAEDAIKAALSDYRIKQQVKEEGK